MAADTRPHSGSRIMTIVQTTNTTAPQYIPRVMNSTLIQFKALSHFVYTLWRTLHDAYMEIQFPTLPNIGCICDQGVKVTRPKKKKLKSGSVVSICSHTYCVIRKGAVSKCFNDYSPPSRFLYISPATQFVMLQQQAEATSTMPVACELRGWERAKLTSGFDCVSVLWNGLRTGRKSSKGTFLKRWSPFHVTSWLLLACSCWLLPQAASSKMLSSCR